MLKFSNVDAGRALSLSFPSSLEFDLPNGRWQIRVRAFGLHLVLSPHVGCDPEGSVCLYEIQNKIPEILTLHVT